MPAHTHLATISYWRMSVPRVLTSDDGVRRVAWVAAYRVPNTESHTPSAWAARCAGAWAHAQPTAAVPCSPAKPRLQHETCALGLSIRFMRERVSEHLVRNLLSSDSALLCSEYVVF